MPEARPNGLIVINGRCLDRPTQGRAQIDLLCGGIEFGNKESIRMSLLVRAAVFFEEASHLFKHSPNQIRAAPMSSRGEDKSQPSSRLAKEVRLHPPIKASRQVRHFNLSPSHRTFKVPDVLVAKKSPVVPPRAGFDTIRARVMGYYNGQNYLRRAIVCSRCRARRVMNFHGGGCERLSLSMSLSPASIARITRLTKPSESPAHVA